MKKLITLWMFSFLMMASFKATAQCGTPVNLAASYSNNVSTFTWDAVPGATEYYFEIDWAGGQWGFGSIPVNTNTYSLTGLMQGGNFQWRVTANCGSLSAPSATAFYSTPCVAPINLSTTNITTNSATLNWQVTNDNPNNTGFSVSYRRANTNNAWIQLTNIYNNITATYFNLTGLTPGTAYEWRVRRACSASNSPYVVSTFVTLSCIPNGVNSAEWIDLFSLGSINRTSGAETNGYANTQLSTNLVIGSNNNAGQISAGFSSIVRNERYSLYIDFNRNGSFDDAGERLVNNANINNAGIVNFAVNIPSTVTAGPTRMRVVMRRSSGTITSCITGYYGEAEDYNVNLVTSGNQPVTNKEIKPALFAKAIAIPGELTVSPNPSFGIFTIRLPKATELLSYEVINTNGEMLQKNNKINSDIIKIDITAQPAGLYILKLSYTNGKQQIQKLQKL